MTGLLVSVPLQPIPILTNIGEYWPIPDTRYRYQSNPSWGLNTLLKKQQDCKKLARDEAAALKAYKIPLVFLLCNICTQTQQKKNTSFVYKFFQLQYCQVLLKGELF